jgi:sugar O-acyltransferase (sialic acid O-acetyltransferase NeuD family)
MRGIDLIYIYGCGGFGREVCDLLSNSMSGQDFHEVTFLDDWATVSQECLGLKVLNPNALNFDLNSKVVIAVGDPNARKILRAKIEKFGLGLFESPHSSESYVSKHAHLENGVILCRNSSIASGAWVDLNVAINVGSIVGHDVSIGSDSSISSLVNLGGGCIVGSQTYIGMGASIREGVKIGSNVIIGMGSVVFSDIPDSVIAIGNPARVIKKNDAGVKFKNTTSKGE